MEALETDQDKKNWILKHWKTMSKETRKESLKRYWGQRSDDQVEEAQKIFNE